MFTPESSNPQSPQNSRITYHWRRPIITFSNAWQVVSTEAFFAAVLFFYLTIHLAYIILHLYAYRIYQLIPFIMKYQNISNFFRDFDRNCFPIFQIFGKPENHTELKKSDIPAFRRSKPNGWNNAKFRAHWAFQSVSSKFFYRQFLEFQSFSFTSRRVLTKRETLRRRKKLQKYPLSISPCQAEGLPTACGRREHNGVVFEVGVIIKI